MIQMDLSLSLSFCAFSIYILCVYASVLLYSKDRVNEPLTRSFIPGFTIKLIPNWKTDIHTHTHIYVYNFLIFPLQFRYRFILAIKSILPFPIHSVFVSPFSHISWNSPSVRLTIVVVKNAEFTYMPSSTASIWLINYWPHVNSWKANQQSVRLNGAMKKKKKKSNKQKLCYMNCLYIAINTLAFRFSSIAFTSITVATISPTFPFSLCIFDFQRMNSMADVKADTFRFEYVCALPILCACKCA